MIPRDREPQYAEPWYEVTVRFRAPNLDTARRMRTTIVAALDKQDVDGHNVYLFTHVFQCPAWLSRVLSHQVNEEVEA